MCRICQSQIWDWEFKRPIFDAAFRLSQIPDFGGLWWLSYLATAMSFAYVSNFFILPLLLIVNLSMSKDRGGTFRSLFWSANLTRSFVPILWLCWILLKGTGVDQKWQKVLDNLLVPISGWLSWVECVAAPLEWVRMSGETCWYVQSFIGLGLSIGKATEKGHDDYGTVWGLANGNSPAQDTWGVFVALG